MSDDKLNLKETPKKAVEKLQSALEAVKNGTGQITPELLAKLAAAQNSLQGKQQQRPPMYTPRGFLIATMIGMQHSVKFLDQFTSFILNRRTSEDNTALSAARSPIIFGFWIILIFVVLGTIWAGTAPLDSAATAVGTVVSGSKKRVINHPEGGIIKKIYVEVGDEVKPGDKLMEFDDSHAKSEYHSVLSQYRAALAAESRLIAEINESESIEYPKILLDETDEPEVTKILATQNNLFSQKREAVNSEINSYKQRIMQFEKQIEGLNARKEASQKSLAVIRDRLEATKQLLKQGYAQKAALLDYEEKEARALSEVAVSDSEIARTEQQITESEIGIVNVKSRSLANALTEIKDVQTRIPELSQRYEELKGRLDRMIVLSSIEGIVNKVEYTTIGSTVPHQANIIELSPKGDKLVVEAKIGPKYIDSIEVNQVSKINFSAFKSRISPVFLGKVIWVSPDVIIESNNNKPVADPSLAGGYYLAHIELDEKDFEEKARPRNLSIRPGMQAEVQIVTGERTLLRYLLDPVFDAMFKGLKEK